MELRAVLVTALAGPLGGFGRAAAAGLQIWARRAASLPHGDGRVRLEVLDAGDDLAAAIREAERLRPHLLFGPYGSGPTLAAVRASDRLVWNQGGASSRLTWPAFPNVVNVPAPATAYLGGALAAIRATDAGADTASLLRGSTGFARDVAGGGGRAAGELGFRVHAAVFESGQAAPAARDLPDADVVLVVGGFEDELAAARTLLQRPWPAAAFVSAGVQEILEPLGAGREGLLGPAQWLATAAPEPDEGPDADWFVAAYRAATGAEPPYPAAQAFAAGLVAARCLRDAGEAEDRALLAAASRLRCTTCYGSFRLDPDTGSQVDKDVLTVQWQQGVRRVVWPPELAQASLRYPRTAPPSPRR